jgi:hypothetical protein
MRTFILLSAHFFSTRRCFPDLRIVGLILPWLYSQINPILNGFGRANISARENEQHFIVFWSTRATVWIAQFFTFFHFVAPSSGGRGDTVTVHGLLQFPQRQLPSVENSGALGFSSPRLPLPFFLGFGWALGFTQGGFVAGQPQHVEV